ncbi:alkaline phosphatase [Sinomicrobium sp. M5D2P17]
MFRSSLSGFLLCLISISVSYAQQPVQIHSHNDYEQNVPFWTAFSGGLSSIEVDIFLRNGRLYATHEEDEIKEERTIESLYLEPLKQTLELGLPMPEHLQLLVDIKSEADVTLDQLTEVLEAYPEITANDNISVVISGNRPSPEKYTDYPEYILFDYQNLERPKDEEVWKKVAMISLNFRNYSEWNGLGRLTEEDCKKVKAVIDSAHALGKPFRFWAAPDSKTAWKAFTDMGLDFINTDTPFRAAEYLNTLEQRIHYNTIASEVYVPTYASDGKEIPVKNVILLIGDGNGLTQISSAVLANGGALTLTQLKNIGFIKTQSADDFTTDSAAGGTALATGEKTYNRAIGMGETEKPLRNITEFLSDNGFISGIITTDKITGATPSAFYAHRKDRSEASGIAEDLSRSSLSLFIGAGKEDFSNEINRHFDVSSSLEGLRQNKADRAGVFLSEGSLPGIIEGRKEVLAKAVAGGLKFLSSKEKPFFLMAEGAKIDSYGHVNNTAGIVSEGIDFDRAVTEAVKFADKTGNTLVIITADHETSGFSIPQGNLKEKMIEGDFTTNDHTGVMVPIFAYGPYSGEFRGVYENNEVFHKIVRILKIKNGEK